MIIPNKNRSNTPHFREPRIPSNLCVNRIPDTTRKYKLKSTSSNIERRNHISTVKTERKLCCHWKPDSNLKSEDRVWLNTKNIRTTRLSKNLDNKKAGPFRILAKIGKGFYKLELPPSMKIHSVFHISLVIPCSDNPLPSQRKDPPQCIETKGEPEYKLDEIIDSQLYCGKQLRYRAKWTGYSLKHDKLWYLASNFENASIVIEQFIKVILTN